MSELNELISAIRDQLAARGLDLLERDDHGSDFTVLVLTRDGPQELAVEVKSSGHSHRVTSSNSATAETEGPLRRPRMMAEDYISTRRGQALRERGIPYVDTVGNMWLELPGVHIAVEGRAAPSRERRPASGDRLSRPSSLRVVFALLTQPLLLQVPVRELAALTGTSVGAAQSATADLAQAGYLHGKSPDRRLRQTGRLADRWVHDFASRLLPKLEQRDTRGPAPSWWFDKRKQRQLQAGTFGGESACELLGYPLRSVETILYGMPPWGPARTLGRLGPDGESVVVLRERFWPPRATSDDIAPPLLVYADLIAAADPRLDEMAATMRESDDELRRLWAG